jgi:hypothetical protein
MIDLNNQNWVEGFVKESGDLGLSADETKQLLAHAAHIEMYKSSEAYREGFDKEAQGLGGVLKGLKGLFSRGPKAPAAKDLKLKPMGPKAKAPAGAGKAPAAGGTKAPLGPVKPLGGKPSGKAPSSATSATGAAATGGKKMKASPASVNKAKDTAAKARGEKGTGSQKAAPKQDAASDTAAAGAAQSKGFFGNAGSRLGNAARIGGGAGLMYGGIKGKELIDDAYMDSDDRFVRDLLENQGQEAVEDYFYQQSKRDFDNAKRYAFANQDKGGKRNFYGVPDYWAGSGI